MSLTMLETLLAHDRWATRQMLDASAAISDEQLSRSFPIGRGSLQATLVHVLSVVHGWQSSIERLEPIVFDEHAPVDVVRDWHARIATDFERFARVQPADEAITASRPPRTLTLPRSAIVAHLLTHSMHHRTQMLNMLRHLGVSPLPKSSVLEWTLATGIAQMSTQGA